MATFEQITARIEQEIAQAAQPTVFHNAPGALGVTFATQDVVVQDGAFHVAAPYARVFADDFNTEGAATNDIRFGHEVIAATVVGSANGPLNVTANGSTAELAIFGTDYNDTVSAYQPFGISPSITLYAMYNVIREGVLDANGVQIDQTPDVEGFRYWQEEMEAGRPLNSVAQAFLSYVPGHDVADNAAFVTMMYEKILNRAPDAGGLQYSIDMLNNAAANGTSMLEARANLFVSLTSSQEFLVGNDIGSQALAWSDANNQIMGASLDAFLGAGDDVVYATIGNNNIDVGAGADQVYLSGYNFGVTNISGIQAFDTIAFIEDNAGMSITKVSVFNNVDGTATVQLQTNWDATINIFTDGPSADAVARSFGSALPVAGQAVEFNGNFNIYQANALLDFNAEQRIELTPGPVVTPDIIGTEGADNLHGTEAGNLIAALGGNDAVSGHDGDDLIDAGTGDNRVWAGNGNDAAVALGGGKNDLSGEAGDDYLVGKVGSVLRGGEHKDDYAVGVDNANTTDRAVIDNLEAWETFQIFGVDADQKIALNFFNNAEGQKDVIGLDVNGDGKSDIDVFVDQYTLDQYIARTGAKIDEYGNAQVIKTAVQVNEDFGVSANGEEITPVGIVGLDNDQFVYTGWQYHNEIA